jgi:16S rRNA (cytosine967-C5)-methyltransferase
VPTRSTSKALVAPARRIAFEVLARVAAGKYAGDELLVEAAPLSHRDAALASQLVFGVLRFQAQLDFLLEYFGHRTPGELELPVLIALRLCIYQLRYLDRIPPHAAVHESVELVKRDSRAAAGLANAILRKVTRETIRWPGKSVELSCPRWLLRKWTSQYGADTAAGIARTALTEPEAYIRVRPGEVPPHDTDLEATDVPGCYRVLGTPPAGYRLQDIGSQAIIPMLRLEPGLSYLDLCAAPGNKTLQALESGVRGIACDISESRLKETPTDCPRVVLDASHPLPFRGRFDRILIDAPCSGTGTLARNPEIKWRVQARSLLRQQQRQRQILREGIAALAPGGWLVYATCSLEAEENEQVVREVLDSAGNVLELIEEKWRLPGRDPGDGFYAAVIRSRLSREEAVAEAE